MMFDDGINSRRLQGTDKKHNYFHPFNFELPLGNFSNTDCRCVYNYSEQYFGNQPLNFEDVSLSVEHTCSFS